MSEKIRQEIHAFYGNKIRIRACGCLKIDGKILLLKHQGIGPEGFFWNVPGGGPNEGELLTDCVSREFLEETGLTVKTKKLLFVKEYIESPLHAVEYYFDVELISGQAKLGYDPENIQTLSQLKWFSKKEFAFIPKKAQPSFLQTILDFDKRK